MGTRGLVPWLGDAVGDGIQMWDQTWALKLYAAPRALCCPRQRAITPLSLGILTFKWGK